MGGDIRVILVGAGRAGLVHGRNLASGVRGARLVGVCEPDDATRESALAELGCEHGFADPMDAVAHDAADALVVASPTFTHAEVAIAALKAGRHVLCEKPLASSLDEAYAIRETARSSDAVFLMGFMRRFDTGFARAAERLEAGDIGEPLLVRSTGRGPGLPPQWAWNVDLSGGLIAEVNAHDLDTVRWLTGQEYRRVYAVGRARKRRDLSERHPGFVDLVTATFEMSGDAIGLVDGACPAGYGYDARVEIYGSEGMLLVGDIRANHTLLVRRDGVVADPVASWRTLFAEAYRAEDQHLAAVVHGIEEPRTTVDDGVAALEAAVATNRSMAAGEPIEFDTVRG
ncbi:Gfo/Idh/MocA family oxidoreductase [Jiangella aurantiaca]|nr:Gfo/Idh/MocA family oxidoreductase [Jiangella aurantiaca]